MPIRHISENGLRRRLPTQQRLKELLRYDPSTGAWTWIVRRGHCAAGSPAGYVEDDGYVRIKIDRITNLAHCLAYIYVTGEHPTADIDHRDLNRANNRWNNIRSSSRSQNKQNQRARSDSLTSLKGVTPFQGKFQARIVVDGTRMFLGSFDTAEAAHEAYVVAAKKYHGAVLWSKPRKACSREAAKPSSCLWNLASVDS